MIKFKGYYGSYYKNNVMIFKINYLFSIEYFKIEMENSVNI